MKTEKSKPILYTVISCTVIIVLLIAYNYLPVEIKPYGKFIYNVLDQLSVFTGIITVPLAIYAYMEFRLWRKSKEKKATAGDLTGNVALILSIRGRSVLQQIYSFCKNSSNSDLNDLAEKDMRISSTSFDQFITADKVAEYGNDYEDNYVCNDITQTLLQLPQNTGIHVYQWVFHEGQDFKGRILEVYSAEVPHDDEGLEKYGTNLAQTIERISGLMSGRELTEVHLFCASINPVSGIALNVLSNRFAVNLYHYDTKLPGETYHFLYRCTK